MTKSCEIVEAHRCIEDLNTRPHNCCCNCKHRVQDFHHCTTVTIPLDLQRKCHCNEPKGWICMGEIAQGGTRAYSGWTEHGECEMHEYKEVTSEPEAEPLVQP